MSKSSESLTIVHDKTSSSDGSVSKKLKERESKELVIAFSGAVGCGLQKSVEAAKEVLLAEAYEIKEIKVSDLIRKAVKIARIDVDLDDKNGKKRIILLQKAGNELRSKFNNEILAGLVVTEISTYRKEKQLDRSDGGLSEYIPPKIAYLVNQLKHPDEVELLKIIYGDLFYLIGVLASENIRKATLIDEGLGEVDAAEVMDNDRKQDISHGQQLEKTLLLADFFIRDNHSNNKILAKQLERFIQLMHGYNGITPTHDEFGMYTAYSASLKSSCLSRQVGASITSKQGIIIATGCNDVPKSKGGLYTERDNPDNRCINKGLCSNDKYKDKLCSEISQILSKELDMDIGKTNKIADKIKDNSRLKDLIEFSRSVHAEMDAIISVAREGGASIQGSALFTTTFPCHNCARHIIASGIETVVYIEPYEKSLALQLHGDDISYDPSETENKTNKVIFLHFEGVSPRQYMSFFCSKGDKKDSKGKVIKNTIHPRHKVAREYLDSYQDFEKKVVSDIKAKNLIECE
ncbi:deoxycytidylate deaminase-related protein [hydrothermal vent metagenome]|uniref:Deoxycytidylate deaminase-related protein n=1 Tax=hydrothermal vent metagenome TaxID=652676 RepID=A0A3B0WZE8_9ZZZZ